MLDEQQQSVNFSVTERLALERTVLGNVRTFFSAIRTSIALLALGASFFKFFDHSFFHTIAVLAIICSVTVIFFGTAQYFAYQRYLNRLR